MNNKELEFIGDQIIEVVNGNFSIAYNVKSERAGKRNAALARKRHFHHAAKLWDHAALEYKKLEEMYSKMEEISAHQHYVLSEKAEIAWNLAEEVESVYDRMQALESDEFA